MTLLWVQIFCEELFQTRSSATRMVAEGTVTSLFWTFLRLRKTCKSTYMSISSDRDGDCHVTLRVTTPGTGFQSPCRGGAQPRGQERQSSGTRNPPPPPAAAAPAPAPAPAATAPVTAKRSKNRGPGALLRDERRRLGRIEPGIFAHETGGEGDPALPLGGRIGDPALPHTAPRPTPRPIVILAARKRKGSPHLPDIQAKGEDAQRPPRPPLHPPRQNGGEHTAPPSSQSGQMEVGARALGCSLVDLWLKS